MNTYPKAFVYFMEEKMKRLEGYYSNDPNDYGGETFFGISRKYNPLWSGWKIIDKIKKDESVSIFEFNEKAFEETKEYIYNFYYTGYWLRMLCNDVEAIEEEIAIELMDQAIHKTIFFAVSNLQTSLNCLNLQGKYWSNLLVDGIIGRKTLEALKKSVDRKRIKSVLKAMNILQGAYYLKVMNHDQSQEKFALGWLDRVNIG